MNWGDAADPYGTEESLSEKGTLSDKPWSDYNRLHAVCAPVPHGRGLLYVRLRGAGGLACHQREPWPPLRLRRADSTCSLMDVARITYREGKTEALTLDDYKALRFEDYAWVLDGLAAPPLCHHEGASTRLKPAEFRALAKLVRSPGVALPPSGGLFEGRSASNESAIRRFEAARSKVEPLRPRGGRVVSNDRRRTESPLLIPARFRTQILHRRAPRASGAGRLSRRRRTDYTGALAAP